MSRGTQVSASSPIAFAYVAITLYGSPFQRASTNNWIGNSTCRGSYNPTVQARWFGLCPRSLAATSGISIDFSSCRY